MRDKSEDKEMHMGSLHDPGGGGGKEKLEQGTKGKEREEGTAEKWQGEKRRKEVIKLQRKCMM